MDPIYIRLQVSRHAAVRAGRREHGAETVAIDTGDLTPGQRETLLTLPFTSRGREQIAPNVYGERYAVDLTSRPDGYHGDQLPLPAIPDASIDSIRLLLDAYPAAVAALAESKRSTADRRIQEALRDMRVRRRYSNDDDQEPQITGTWIGDYAELTLQQATPDLAAAYRQRRAEIDAEYKLQYAGFEARRAARRAAETAEKEAAAARRREQVASWVQQHGSPSQQARLAEGVLPQQEIIDTIETAAFARLAIFPVYAGPIAQPVAKTAATAAEFEALLNIRAVLSRVPPMVGDAALMTSECQGGAWIRVTVTCGEFSFTRDFAAGD